MQIVKLCRERGSSLIVMKMKEKKKKKLEFKSCQEGTALVNVPGLSQNIWKGATQR